MSINDSGAAVLSVRLVSEHLHSDILPWATVIHRRCLRRKNNIIRPPIALTTMLNHRESTQHIELSLVRQHQAEGRSQWSHLTAPTDLTGSGIWGTPLHPSQGFKKTAVVKKDKKVAEPTSDQHLPTPTQNITTKREAGTTSSRRYYPHLPHN